jgi:hypothetical protein
VHDADQVAVAQLGRQPPPVDHRRRPRVHASAAVRALSGAAAGSSHGGAGGVTVSPGMSPGSRPTRATTEGGGNVVLTCRGRSARPRPAASSSTC